MFGFEGLGCIYWHMVSKLLLAVQENFFVALERGAEQATCRRLGQLYYRVRAGLGFNKTPSQYGAFPTDPYSHTPGHAGARQPGMTGQVKEEVLSRFGELGLRIVDGQLRFEPRLLRSAEFVSEAHSFRYLDVDGRWQTLAVPRLGLAFTWCQVPVVYCLAEDPATSIEVSLRDGRTLSLAQSWLPAEQSAAVFSRNGDLRRITVRLPRSLLLDI
jgi:hypothetical protein